MHSLLTTLILVAMLTSCGKSANILIIPNESISHVLYFTHFSKLLVQREHNVYALMNAACKQSVSVLEKSGITVLPYSNEDNSCMSENPDDTNYVGQVFNQKGDFWKTIKRQSEIFSKGTDGILNEVYIDHIRSLNIDFCVVDGFLLTLFNYIIPCKLGVPYASLTTSYSDVFMGVPGLPSFTPVIQSTFSDRMNFQERLENTLKVIGQYPLLSSFAGNQDSLVKKYAPEKPLVSLFDLMRRSKLWFLNTDVALDYPRPTLPHVIHVGGLSTSPASPLAQPLQDIMDTAENGVILLSFGSLAKNLPDYVINKVINAFKKLNDYTIVMKYNGPPIAMDVPAHVHLYSWFPQNDLLGHPSVKLFITHCGNNGQFEALYHGVPMLGLPLLGDQIYNANRMAVKGFGIHMSIVDFTSDELYTNIQEMLSNQSYIESIGKASEIYHSRPMTARERSLYWVEHVIQFGSDYLISHATKLSWCEFYLVDVFAAIIIPPILVFILVLCGIRLTLRRVFGVGAKVKTN